MMATQLKNDVIPQPFMFRFAEPRTECDEIPGAYDPASQVWCIQAEELSIPIVEADDAALEITTKTKVRQEADDQVGSLMQMRTKTFVTEETDDAQHKRSMLLEITTKTDAQVESDDRPIQAALLGISTKTSAHVESDDRRMF